MSHPLRHPFITARFRITYACSNPNCDYKYTAAFLPKSIIALSKLHLFARNLKACVQCQSTMQVVNMVALPMRSVYGDFDHGVWECSRHYELIRVYPAPLKIAKTKEVTWHMAKMNYNQIVNRGFPWRCPQCDNLLTYKLEGTNFD